jgi:hypothetical protein
LPANRPLKARDTLGIGLAGVKLSIFLSSSFSRLSLATGDDRLAKPSASVYLGLLQPEWLRAVRMTSSLRERINIELKDAIRSQERRRMSTLRLVSAAIKDRMIQNRSAGKAEQTSDAEVREILAKMIKQRRDSTQAYEAGGRPELAQSEREEITIIEEFLPRQLSDDEIREAVRSVVAEVGGGLKDMGKVMAALKERYGGQMDMSRASALAKDMLS